MHGILLCHFAWLAWVAAVVVCIPLIAFGLGYVRVIIRRLSDIRTEWRRFRRGGRR